MDHHFVFAWEKLSVLCPAKTKNQNSAYILKEISGYVESRSLVAIMGPSGAGKTTFLAALSGRLKNVNGVTKINNRPMKHSEIVKMSGYVSQDDIFEEYLTVKEHLKFNGALKRVTPTALDAAIKDLLFEFNLERCQHNPLRYLSGGERRRVSLAAELITNPRVLFCDEPTSGLDSFNATTIMQQLKQRTDCGMLAMVTIHQPSSQVFDYFNHVVLLSDGAMVFNGAKDDMEEFFKSVDLVCPKSYNVSDFYIKCVTIMPDDRAESHRRVKMLTQAYARKAKKSRFTTGVNGIPNGTTNNRAVTQKRYCDWLLQIRWLVWRSSIATARNFRNKIIHIALHMLAAVLIGVCYAASSTRDEYRFQNVSGAIVIIITQLLFTEMYAVIGVFPSEYALYLREKSLYSHVAYFISSVLVVLPRIVACNFLFPVVVHLFFPWIASVRQYFELCGIFAIGSLTMSTLGLSLSTVIPRIEYLQIVLVPFETVCMTLMGGWINVESIPRYFMWIKYVSPFYYSYEAISITVWSESGEVECSSNTTNSCVTGKDFLLSLGLHPNKIYVLNDISYLAIYVVTCCLVGFIALSRTR